MDLDSRPRHAEVELRIGDRMLRVERHGTAAAAALVAAERREGMDNAHEGSPWASC